MLGSSIQAGGNFKELLNTIDQVRVQLCEVQDQSFYEELLAALPQFVACGPQSAGKSSVIRRVSGIALPEAATLCTRVATMIQMRREPVTSIKVSLVGPEGHSLLEETYDDSAHVTACVAKAQELARGPDKKEFVDDHTVIIRVCGPDRRNVTLIDLPGFHTADDADAQKVNQMVRRYVQMPGTLSMHVIKGDQDYGSLLGNDFMRQHSINRVTVLTHCDNLSTTSDDRAKLRQTLDQASANSSVTFAVDGSAETDITDDNEVKKLMPVSQMDPRLETGASALADHLEQRMKEHLYTQYPKALRKLKQYLEHTAQRLEEIDDDCPADAVHKMARQVLSSFKQGKRELMNGLRPLLEKMTQDIKNHVLQPVSSVKSFNLRDRDEFDEPFEVGQVNWVKINQEDKHLTDVVITSIKGTTVSFEDARDPKRTCTRQVTDKNICSGELHTNVDLITDIKALASDRGLRNLVHIDRQPIIAAYAADFAKHYTKAIQAAKQKVGAHIGKFFDQIFVDGLSASVRPAAQMLRTRLKEVEEELAANADEAICAMKAYNTDPNLIFSSNEHYLNGLIQKMVAADKEMNSDLAGSRHIMHNVRAFIKVQRKLISELASKELVRTLLSDSESRLEDLLSSKISQYEKFVQEPDSLIREREMLQKRKTILQQAIDTLKECEI